jgi:hypothetical protein
VVRRSTTAWVGRRADQVAVAEYAELLDQTIVGA